MSARRLGVAMGFGVALVGLVLVAVAPATTRAVSGKLIITGSGTDWTLTFENAASSTDPIICWRYTFPPGVMATGIGQPPSGWQLGASKPPPAPDVGGRSSTGIPPGGKASFPIKTDKPFDLAGSPGTVAISGDCAKDVPAEVQFSAPAPPPPPPAPTPKRCECKKLTVVGKNYSSAQVNTGPTSLKLQLRWFLGCSAGKGSCVGKLKLAPPTGTDIAIVTPAKTTITCNGKCDPNGPTTATGTVPLKLTSTNTLDFDKRRGQTVVIRIQQFCVRSGKERFVGTSKLSLVFAGSGLLDKKKSDLNGNGKPDGMEKG